MSTSRAPRSPTHWSSKGSDLKELLETTVGLVGVELRNEIVEVDLGEIPLKSAVAAFDANGAALAGPPGRIRAAAFLSNSYRKGRYA